MFCCLLFQGFILQKYSILKSHPVESLCIDSYWIITYLFNTILVLFQYPESQRQAEDERDRDRERKKDERQRLKEYSSKEENKDGANHPSLPSSEEYRGAGKDPRANPHLSFSTSLAQQQPYMHYMHGYPYGQGYDPNHPGYRGMPSVMMQNFPGRIRKGFVFDSDWIVKGFESCSTTVLIRVGSNHSLTAICHSVITPVRFFFYFVTLLSLWQQWMVRILASKNSFIATLVSAAGVKPQCRILFPLELVSKTTCKYFSYWESPQWIVVHIIEFPSWSDPPINLVWKPIIHCASLCSLGTGVTSRPRLLLW